MLLPIPAPSPGLLALACAIVVLPLAIAAAPVPGAALLLVSLRGEADGTIAGWATRGGLALVGRGPVDGSLVVYSATPGAAALAWRHGAIALRAPQPGCGTAP